jgi:hypothetical protein
MQKEQEVIYKVTVAYKQGHGGNTEIICEAFGPMEGSCMIAFYKKGNTDNVPDIMINEECIHSIDTLRMIKR